MKIDMVKYCFKCVNLHQYYDNGIKYKCLKHNIDMEDEPNYLTICDDLCKSAFDEDDD